MSTTLSINMTGGQDGGLRCGADPAAAAFFTHVWHHEDGGFNSLLMRYLPSLSYAVAGLLTVLSCVYWSLYYSGQRSPSSQLPLPPGSMGLPFVGETLHFALRGVSEFFSSRHKKYGRVYKTHVLFRPTVRVTGAENVRKVLMGENTLVASSWPSSVRLVLGTNNISMSKGERHRYLRKGVLKAFSHDALSSYVPEMQSQVRHYLHSWCCQKQQDSEGRDIPPVLGYIQCRSLTFSVVCKALLGLSHLRRPQMDQLLQVFETFADGLFSVPLNVPGWGLSKGLEARRTLLQKIDEWMQSKAETGVTEAAGNEVTSSPSSSSSSSPSSSWSSGQRTDVLQLLMTRSPGHEERGLTREEMKEVCLDLMFAGHATVASAATSLLYFLARTPRVVERVLKELEEHGLRESQAGDLTFDTVTKLTYVGHVVKEVLRLMPPVGGAFRKALKTFELDGYQIPEGWSVSLSIRETHAFSDLFTEQEQFQPERWEQPLRPGEETFNFLPFGRGARSCVGKEYAKLLLKILAVEMCRGCRWRLLNEDVKFKFMPVPHPVDSLPMLVTEREPPSSSHKSS